jgi:hypothetical protein
MYIILQELSEYEQFTVLGVASTKVRARARAHELQESGSNNFALEDLYVVSVTVNEFTGDDPTRFAVPLFRKKKKKKE